ncbi:MAG: autotransporter domain-containing protein [Ahrensia sp.]|nr:autotransporter domain-containing protein [Ahrensia sp.]
MSLRKTLASLLAATAMAFGTTKALATDRLIVFGDSLSDGGFFGTVVPGLTPDTASFTTNPDDVAPEVFASIIGLPLNLAYGPGGMPNGGTNFAIGGARVTLPNANGQVPFSITQQIDLFLASGGSFDGSDTVYIQGGGNDFFAFAGAGGTDPTILTNAANDLATQVARLEAAGVGNIVTLSVQSGGAAPIQAFNMAYKQALAANGANVLFFDTDILFNEIIFDALAQGGATFGITNITGNACLSGNSLGCTAAQFATPDANRTFALADDVHPTGIVQEIQGQAIASVFNAGEQVAQLAYGAIAVFRSQTEIAASGRLPAASADGTATFLPGGEGSGTVAYVTAGIHGFENDTGRADDIDQDGYTLAAGIEHEFLPQLIAGLTFAWTDGDGDFGIGGGYDFDAYSATAYLRGTAETAMPVNYHASATYGRIDYDDITRPVVLGPSIRRHVGSTDADYFAIRGGVELDAATLGGFTVGPEVALSYESIDIDGFTTSGALPNGAAFSTNVAFGDIDLDQFTGRIGVFARGNFDGFELGGRVSWNYAFGDDDISVTTRSTGAPVAFTRNVGDVDESYLSFEISASGHLSERAKLTAAISGDLFRDDQTRLAGKIGLDIAF